MSKASVIIAVACSRCNASVSSQAEFGKCPEGWIWVGDELHHPIPASWSVVTHNLYRDRWISKTMIQCADCTDYLLKEMRFHE